MAKRVRYFYDTEFLEDGKTIDLISIGMVSEDGREYYAVSSEFDAFRVSQDDWLMKNVMSSIKHEELPFFGLVLTDSTVKTRRQIKDDILEFTKDTWPEFWGNYSGFDYVCLAQLFGRMTDWPNRFPMFVRDIQQLKRNLNVKELPEQQQGQHNALDDARHCKVQFEYLEKIFNDSGLQTL